MSATPELTDLQLSLLRVLWRKGEATAAEVTAAIRRPRNLALNTVGTLLTRLEKKGVITHRTEGRTFIYRALVAETEVRKTLLSRVTAVFEGDVAAMLSQLLNAQEVTGEDLARARDLIDARERELQELGDD